MIWSARPLASPRRPPARMAMTGRVRAVARAAEMKARRFRTRRRSSSTAPVPASRASQSSAAAKPITALPPMPMTWLKPSRSAAAQSSTARARAADWVTSASRPGAGVRCASVALSPIPGTASPKLPWPSARTPVRRESSASSAAGPGTTAARQPRAASAAMAGPSAASGTARTARSGASGRSAMLPAGSSPGAAMPMAKARPWKPPAAMFRASTEASGMAGSASSTRLRGR